ncbi:hypothetical protein RhiirA5_420705 [Rhizophagus irregularis]|uniref:Uncharacterized protein n=1 Tax=Rhizophagus irregularis TaxID=588596 RepID=A0A2I1EVG5_9GLOM|nr:hypothetical protein RhiirA5_420705 [Rhizophagus irregularis]PKC61499.1 hypothetical protein RhiirA1_466442 [Rhizophagus irregularis]PKY26116.1 hypothetical protein RhiirB3_441308 [Rhizophagus irregularis]
MLRTTNKKYFWDLTYISIFWDPAISSFTKFRIYYGVLPATLLLYIFDLTEIGQIYL